MDENDWLWAKFWIALACIVALLVSSLVAIGVWDNRNAYRAINEMVGRGIDPIAAGCAIWGMSGSEARAAVCVAAAVKR